MLSIFLFIFGLFVILRSIGKANSRMDKIERANKIALYTLENDINGMLGNLRSRIKEISQ